MKAIISALALGLSAGLCRGQGTTAIRTFVNGTGQAVSDLHIEYSKPLVQFGYLGQPPLPQITPSGGNKRLDVVFPNALPAGRSVTLWGRTAQQNGLAITKWWWTSDPTNPNSRVGPVNDATIRGDETREQRNDKKRQDNFTIINKGHHWGGAERNKPGGGKVQLTMNIDKLLQRVPANQRDTVKKLVLAAIKQWTDCTMTTTLGNVPKAGENGNPLNAGAGLDPPVMAPGPTHKGGARGTKFRSVTRRECDAAFVKYRNGLQITLVEGNVNNADIPVVWGVPARYGGALGAGPSWPAGTNGADKHRTKKGAIYMKPQRGRVKWHYATDVDGDGYITNKDGDTVPADHYDFYSIFKHELGHVLCFNHSGVNFTDVNPHFNAPGQQRQASPGCCPGCCPHGHAPGESEEREPGSFYFSHKEPGSTSGYDIWEAIPDPETGNWDVNPLGPEVNSPFNEMDPHLAVDATTLLFTSDRPGGQGGFDVYESIRSEDDTNWTEAVILPQINSPQNELSPSLTADMKSLYFVSDRPGGFGGLDVYQAELVWDEDFSFPVNLGSEINSPTDERGVSANATGDGLVLSSDRVGGFGGADLYLTVMGTNGWTVPQNIGPQINTPANEFDPSIRSDHNWLFYVSDESGEPQIQESFLHPLGYRAWLADYLNPTQMQDLVLTDPLNDLDGDGNLLLHEYAANGHPTQPEDAIGPRLMPGTNGEEMVILSLNRDAFDLDAILEGTTDFETWLSFDGIPFFELAEQYLEGPNRVHLFRIRDPAAANQNRYNVRAQYLLILEDKAGKDEQVERKNDGVGRSADPGSGEQSSAN